MDKLTSSRTIVCTRLAAQIDLNANTNLNRVVARFVVLIDSHGGDVTPASQCLGLYRAIEYPEERKKQTGT